MQVHLFGRLADHGARVVEIAVPPGGCTLSELRTLISECDAALGHAIGAPGVRACVGRDFVEPDHRLDGSEVVEFWPPVSGG